MKRETISKRIVLAACLLFVCGGDTRAQAQDSTGEEKRNNIRRFLQLSRAGETGVQIGQLMLPELRNLYSALLAALPAEKRQKAVQIMEEELLRTFTAERMVEEWIPVYDKHLTGEEVKDLIAFYESPTGRKFVSVLPQILTDASGITDKLAEEGAKRIQSWMRAEGITIPPPAGRRTTRSRP